MDSPLYLPPPNPTLFPLSYTPSLTPSAISAEFHPQPGLYTRTQAVYTPSRIFAGQAGIETNVAGAFMHS